MLRFEHNLKKMDENVQNCEKLRVLGSSPISEVLKDHCIWLKIGMDMHS
jgi:hypothetical protein